ncbi:uncharacterized protein LOC131088681 [Melospiza georgiana]|uniref:uncharacterized protein LOC131088681 n=1 Tax=Melospiza georgiana TaxID=44398 RepID=UPI0025ABDDD6|nr:uncharacterized protein LOC131088681 [Melospiza georgiana]
MPERRCRCGARVPVRVRARVPPGLIAAPRTERRRHRPHRRRPPPGGARGSAGRAGGQEGRGGDAPRGGARHFRAAAEGGGGRGRAGPGPESRDVPEAFGHRHGAALGRARSRVSPPRPSKLRPSRLQPFPALMAAVFSVVASSLAAPGKWRSMCASYEVVFKRRKGFRNLRDPVKACSKDCYRHLFPPFLAFPLQESCVEGDGGRARTPLAFVSKFYLAAVHLVEKLLVLVINAKSSCGWNSQEKGWLCVPVCSGLCQQKDRGNDISARSILSISEFQLCTSEPPSCIAANLLLGVSDQVFRAKSCIFGFSWKPGHKALDCSWEFITSLPGHANFTGTPSANNEMKENMTRAPEEGKMCLLEGRKTLELLITTRHSDETRKSGLKGMRLWSMKKYSKTTMEEERGVSVLTLVPHSLQPLLIGRAGNRCCSSLLPAAREG